MLKYTAAAAAAARKYEKLVLIFLGDKLNLVMDIVNPSQDIVFRE